MEYKLIACDLDGTLLDEECSVSEKNLFYIDKISRRDVEFAICTGRTFFEIPKPLRECGAIRYIIFSDGAVLYDKKTGKNVFENYIPQKTVLSLYEMIDKYDTMIEIYENGNAKTSRSKLSDEAFEYYNIDKGYIDTIKNTRLGFDDFAGELVNFDRAELFNIFFKNQAQRNACFEELKVQECINFTTSMDNNIEITAGSASKGNALARLAEHLGIERESIVTAGDSSNDISMFAVGGLSFAPSNAADSVKELADEIACPNSEAIAQYLYNKLF